MSIINLSIKPTSTEVVCRHRLDGGYHYIQSRLDVNLQARDLTEVVAEYIDYLMYWYDYNIQITGPLMARGVRHGWMLVEVEVELD